MDHLDNDEKFLLSSHDFTAYVNGVECTTPWVVTPDDIDTDMSIYMLPGSVATAWMIYEVPKNEQVIIAYDRIFVDSTYYFNSGTGNFVFSTTPEPDANSEYHKKPESQIIKYDEPTRSESGHHLPNPIYNDLICPNELIKYDRSHDGNLSKDELRQVKNKYIMNDLSQKEIAVYKKNRRLVCINQNF